MVRSNAKNRPSAYSKRLGRTRKVPIAIKDGLKRRPRGTKSIQCKKCGRYFKNLPDLNVHYSVAKNHEKQKHPVKPRNFAKLIKAVDPSLTESEVQEAATIYLALKHPEKLRQAIQEELARRFKR